METTDCILVKKVEVLELKVEDQTWRISDLELKIEEQAIRIKILEAVVEYLKSGISERLNRIRSDCLSVSDHPYACGCKSQD